MPALCWASPSCKALLFPFWIWVNCGSEILSLTPQQEFSTKRQGGGETQRGLPKTLVWETESVLPSTHLTRTGWRCRQPLALGQQVQEAAESRDISFTSHHPQEFLGPEGTQVTEGKRGAGD